ncbi:MAG: outer membrane beta-barrel protein [Thermodesulfobacteriota bacterium]
MDSNHQPFITNLRRETAQALKEITLTPEFRLAKGLILRPEYRYDWSDQNSFNSGKNKDQHTIALGVMYTW